MRRFPFFLKRASNGCQINLDLGVQIKKMIGYIVGNIYCTFCTDHDVFVVIIFVIKRNLLIVIFNSVK